MTDAIDNYAESLRQTVTQASLCYEIWRVHRDVLDGVEIYREEAETILAGINAYPLFFQPSIHAHFVATLVALYRLYETRPDTFNVPSFLKMLQQEGNIPEATLEKLRALNSEAKPLWIKVGILRNEAFGHRSQDQSVSEVFEKANATPDNLGNLVKMTKYLLNMATSARNGTRHAFNLSSKADTLSLLRMLGKGRSEP